MKGQLSEYPLAELIREISGKTLSGSLRLEHEHSKVVVYLEQGRVIYAAANVRTLRLTDYVKKHQLADEKQLAKYADKGSDLALAAALRADGIARQEDINTLLRGLVADAIRLALLWANGTWELNQRARLTDPVRVDVDLSPLLLECARRVGVNIASSRFTNPDELISPGSRSSFEGLLPTEGFLLSRVEGPIKVRDLVAVSGLPEPDAFRIIYGLTLAGYLQREKWTEALRSVAGAVPPRPSLAIPAIPKRTEEEDLRDFLDRMDVAGNYYEVLDIGPDTPAENIKESYYGAARKYHPDRFRGRTETPLHSRLESAFARITQAYETLMDASRRKAYDAKLAATEKAKNLARKAPKATTPAGVYDQRQDQAKVGSESESRQTEDIFKEGFAALQQGQINVAIGLLAAAARAVPGESRYRAYYGRALAVNAKTRRSAESELQAAIKIDPNNAAYRVMVAELYRDLGFPRRALAEAERALALEPGDARVQELVRNLK